MLSKLLLLFATLFLLGGCALKSAIPPERAVLLLLKTKKLKFYDTGFIKVNSLSVDASILNAGVVVLDLNIFNNKVCLNKICQKPDDFNYLYLYKDYPTFILQNIFSAQPIYNEYRITKYKNGFTQYIKDKNIDISYKVDDKMIYFKDKKNGILIKIKEIQQ